MPLHYYEYSTTKYLYTTMGAKGTHFELVRERDADLLRAYREALALAVPPFRMIDVVRRAITLPASRFWVSFERASWQVSRLDKGLALKDVTSSHHTEMYGEIYRRVRELMRLHPSMEMADAVLEVISAPAPRFYFTPGTAMVLICRARKRLRHSSR